MVTSWEHALGVILQGGKSKKSERIGAWFGGSVVVSCLGRRCWVLIRIFSSLKGPKWYCHRADRDWHCVIEVNDNTRTLW